MKLKQNGVAFIIFVSDAPDAEFKFRDVFAPLKREKYDYCWRASKNYLIEDLIIQINAFRTMRSLHAIDFMFKIDIHFDDENKIIKIFNNNAVVDINVKTLEI